MFLQALSVVPPGLPVDAGAALRARLKYASRSMSTA